MKLLLDTHIFLWWAECPEQMPLQAASLCSNPQNELFLSMASIWEMQIKRQQGKLKFSKSLKSIVDSQIGINDLKLLPIQAEHIFSLEELPLHHRDPFDRLIIAQSKSEGIKLVSVDGIFEKYGLEIIHR